MDDGRLLGVAVSHPKHQTPKVMLGYSHRKFFSLFNQVIKRASFHVLHHKVKTLSVWAIDELNSLDYVWVFKMFYLIYLALYRFAFAFRKQH